MDDPVQAIEVARQAFAFFQRGDLVAAESSCRRALAADGDNVATLGLLGLVLAQQGRSGEALSVFQRQTVLEPAKAKHWTDLATILQHLRRYDEALAAFAQAASLGERSADFFFNVGLLHQDRGDFETARRVLADAMAAAPRDVEIVVQYAQCCYESLRLEEAVQALAGWRTLEGLDAERLAQLGLLLLNLGESAASAEARAAALAAPTHSEGALLRLAQVAERCNRVDEAEQLLTRLRGLAGTRAVDPDVNLLEAQLALRARKFDVASTQFRALADRCEEPHRRQLYLFPLAKALDGAGRRDDAMTCLADAHSAQLLHLERTSPAIAAHSEPPLVITRRGVDPADFARWDDDDGPGAAMSPVFIVAFPRSGTTLLEQMLDAHSGLVTMDEQPYLQHAIDHITDGGVDYPAGLAALSLAQLSDAREHYWKLTRRNVTLRPGQRLIDKNPLNLLRLPAIRRLFPRAQVLLAIRHPCDVLLSCYFQHFRAPEFALLCRDLPTLARGYRRSFDFWYAQAAAVGAEPLEIRYESFVSDFDSEARRIIRWLGLPWTDSLLEPGSHARARGFISTPSYTQVIEPVNRRAIDRWRAYEKHFEAVIPEIRGYLDRWDYVA